MAFRTDLYLDTFMKGLNGIESVQAPNGKFIFPNVIFQNLGDLEGDTPEHARSLLKLHIRDALKSEPVEGIDRFFENFYKGVIFTRK